MRADPLTLGQRTFRLTASAVMCGVALSYLIGGQFSETVKSKLLDSDKAISLSALTPYAKLAEWTHNIDWSAQFAAQDAAIEQEEPIVIIETPAIVKAPKLLARHIYKSSRPIIKDSLVSAIPSQVVWQKTKLHKKVVPILSPAPAQQVTLGLDEDTEFSSKLKAYELPELYELLLRDRVAYHRVLPIKNLAIQTNHSDKDELLEANSQTTPANLDSIIAQSEEVSPAETAAVDIQSEKIISAANFSRHIEAEPLPEKAPELKPSGDFTVVNLAAVPPTKYQPPKPADQVIVSSQPRPPKTSTPAPQKIMGRIYGPIENYPGHFEIGLYGARGVEGGPIGAPLAWSSLRSSESSFSLAVNTQKDIQSAYLFLHYLPSDGGEERWFASQLNPLSALAPTGTYYTFQLPARDIVNSSKMAATSRAPAEKHIYIRGRITTMFSAASDGNAIAHAEVKLRGTKLGTIADANGAFKLELPAGAKKVLLELSKAGYAPSIFTVDSADTELKHFELISRQFLDRLALSVGLRQSSSESAMVVKIKNSQGEGLPGFSAQLLTHRADGPFYFDKEGLLSRSNDVRSTAFDGRMVFFNIPSGNANLEISMLGGDAFAPLPITTVEGGEVLFYELEPISAKLDGRVLDATGGAKPAAVAGARVRVEGSSQSAATDNVGYFTLPQFKFFKDQTINLEVNHGDDYTHLYTMTGPRAEAVLTKNLYMFPLKYINNMAARSGVELDLQQSGIIIGALGAGHKVRIDTMSDQGGMNLARDFYFDKKQNMLGSHAFTDPKYGTFAIFNAPRGRTMLDGYDPSAVLKYSHTIFTAPATVSVIQPEE